MTRKTIIQALQEAHQKDLKNIQEGIGTILQKQDKLQKSIDELQPIKEEWPTLKNTVININKRLLVVERKVDVLDRNLDNLDKKVAAVLPDHEKRLMHLEAKPA